MKQILLFSLLLAGFTHPIFAQHPYLEALQGHPDLVKKLEPYFNQPKADPRGNVELRLDSILYNNQYQGSDSALYYLVRFDNSQPNIKSDNYFNVDPLTGAYIPGSQTLREFDVLGRIIRFEISYYDAASQALKPSLKLLTYPRGNSLVQVDSIVLFQRDWTTPPHDLFKAGTEKEYNYDAQDRLLSFTTYNYTADGGSLGIIHRDYSYLPDGKIENLLILSGASLFDLIPQNNFAYAYSGDTSQITGSQFDQFTQSWTPQNRSTRLEIGNNVEKYSKSEAWEAATQSWVLQYFSITEVDAQNRPLTRYSESHYDPNMPTASLKTYSYISDDNVNFEINYDIDLQTGNKTINNKGYYFYSAISGINAIAANAENHVTLSPNPASASVRLQSEDEQLLNVSLFDARGMLLRSYHPENHSLQIGRENLPAGIYTLRIQSSGGSCFKKLIWE